MENYDLERSECNEGKDGSRGRGPMKEPRSTGKTINYQGKFGKQLGFVRLFLLSVRKPIFAISFEMAGYPKVETEISQREK